MGSTLTLPDTPVQIRGDILNDVTPLHQPVRDVQVVKSVHPDLDNAAVEAVRQWLFDGTMLNCNPVDVTMNVSIDFGIAQ